MEPGVRGRRVTCRAAAVMPTLCAVALAGRLFLGCAAPVKLYRCGDLAVRPTVDAREVWDCHREIVVRVVKGKEFTLRELSRAATFFEETTGIPADLDSSHGGPLPGPDLERSLRLWDGWLSKHENDLSWDPVDRRIRTSEREP